MRHVARLVYCAACAATIVLAGCSGGGDVTAPAAGNVFQQESVRLRPLTGLSNAYPIREALPLLAMQGLGKRVKAFVNSAALAKQPITIAVSNAGTRVVEIYDPAGEKLAQLTGFEGPEGLASDSKGDLYVADLANQRVQIYAAGFQTPPTTLSVTGYLPSGVDGFNNGQIVAVTNYSSAIDGGPGNVEFFTNGRLTNTIQTATSPFAFVFGCAFDAVGNLYIQGLDTKNTSRVGEIVGGAQGNAMTLLTTSGMKLYPFYVQVTTGGQIAVGTLNSQNAVYTYDPPVGGSLGSPVSVTPLTGSPDAQAFAFTKNMASLYEVSINNGPDFGYADIQQDAYPAGGKALSTIRVGGIPDGIAVIPTQYPKVRK